MLLTLATIAVLSGFSAIGFFAVQNNANLRSNAQTAPSTTGTGPSGPSTTKGGGTTPGSTDGIACTIDQDCIDYLTKSGKCPAGSTCPPPGIIFSCISGFCIAAPTNPGTPITPGISQIPTKSCPTQRSGDFDCSGVNDCADLKLFIAELSGASSSKNSDINTDGKVSLIDFELVRPTNVSIWGSCSL